MAVARQWFDCSPPQVITVSAPVGGGLGEEELELADLVARQRRAGEIVALDEQLDAELVRQLARRLHAAWADARV